MEPMVESGTHQEPYNDTSRKYQTQMTVTANLPPDIFLLVTLFRRGDRHDMSLAAARQKSIWDAIRV
jgi:hypothetical protein